MDLPSFAVNGIKVKIDTGAASSSLHAFAVEQFNREGLEWVRFDIHPSQRDGSGAVKVEAPLAGMKLVRNPGGRSELRPFIRTDVAWNGLVWQVRLNLTHRDEMGFRMLLGREAVRRRFLVDPGRSFLGGPESTNEKS